MSKETITDPWLLLFIRFYPFLNNATIIALRPVYGKRFALFFGVFCPVYKGKERPFLGAFFRED